MSISTSILFCIQLNEEKLIHFMEFEIHDILHHNTFAVYSLKGKAREAYDSVRQVKSSRFQNLLSLTLLVSVLDLCL